MPERITKPTNIDKAWIAADPAAALIGYASTILAVFGVFEKLGLDADQVAILGGAVLGVVASLRTLRERRHRKDMLELVSERGDRGARGTEAQGDHADVAGEDDRAVGVVGGGGRDAGVED